MNVRDVLAQLAAIGGELVQKQPEGRLVVRAPKGTLTTELLDEVAAHKDELRRMITEGVPLSPAGHSLSPEQCPRCGGNTFRDACGSCVCDSCFPESCKPPVPAPGEAYVQPAAAVDHADARGTSANDAKPHPALEGDPLPLEAVLKGKAIELWSDLAGERLWLVADKEDALKVGEPRGSIYTADEARRVVQINDPVVVREIHQWKRAFNGRVSEFRKRERSIGQIPVKIGLPEGKMEETRADLPRTGDSG